ncbi:unnamed protein product [Didymodactylos carnosus]|nr:unnamed protein product [Didymodactylos carnosus]CAF4111149.1 unnamed protein product [Didymodactylos carnosus]
MYKSICEQTSFIPISDSSLYRILRPSQLKTLSGLDNVTTDGLEAYSTIENRLSQLNLDPSIQNRIKFNLTKSRYTLNNHIEKGDNIDIKNELQYDMHTSQNSVIN